MLWLLHHYILTPTYFEIALFRNYWNFSEKKVTYETNKVTKTHSGFLISKGMVEQVSCCLTGLDTYCKIQPN